MAFEAEGMTEAKTERQEQSMGSVCVGGRGKTTGGRGQASKRRPFPLGSGLPLKVLTGPGQMSL